MRNKQQRNRNIQKENIFGNFSESLDGEDWLVEKNGEGLEAIEVKESEGISKEEGGRLPWRKQLFLLFLISGVFITILCRLVFLQLIRGGYYLSLAEGNRIRTRIIHAPRGMIFDRQKNILAKNVPNFEVKITPKDLPANPQEKNKVIQKLSELIQEPTENIQNILNKKGKIDQFEPVLIKENIEYEKALVLEINLKDLPGVSLEKNPRREYLFGPEFSHIIGYTGRVDEETLKTHKDYHLDDYIGKCGIEAFYEKELKGKDGKKQVEVDASGKTIREIASYNYQAGASLVTSLDSNLQKEVIAALSEGLQKAGVKKGAVVVENPQTGEILSLVSLPTFDNNLFALGIKPEDYNALVNDELQPLFNRAVSGSYLIGSTIKPVVAAAGLQEGVITPSTIINCRGAIEVPNQYNPAIIYTFTCWLRSGHGPLNVVGGLAQSCNVFFYTVGGGYGNISGLGAERLARYMHEFGLGEKTGIDLPDEATGLVPTPAWKEAAKGETWYQGDTYNMSIGQGDVLATPLQLAGYTSCIASGGVLFQPQIVRQIIKPDGTILKDFQPIIRRKNFIDPANIEVVKEGMRKAVTAGTARRLNSLPFSVAGKTGTAELVRGGKKHAWFTCFAPYENPQVVVTVLLEEGGEGSDYAVPVAQRILEYYFRKK